MTVLGNFTLIRRPIIEGKSGSAERNCKSHATICEIADLPLGWIATRKGKGENWTRAKKNG